MVAMLLGLLGLVIGSFIAVFVVRWPQHRPIAFSRSTCDSCGTRLAVIDLVPLLSALALRGRCRTCSAAIPALHWQIELAAFAVGVAAGSASSLPEALAGAIFGWLLLALASLDMTALVLPNLLNAGLWIAGLLMSQVNIEPSLSDRLIGGAAGYGALWVVKHGYRQLRGREGLGGGDPKLLGAIGCWLGWRPLPILLLCASLLGIGYVLIEAARGHRLGADHRLPFGAMLAASAFLAWLAMGYGVWAN